MVLGLKLPKSTILEVADLLPEKSAPWQNGTWCSTRTFSSLYPRGHVGLCKEKAVHLHTLYSSPAFAFRSSGVTMTTNLIARSFRNIS